MKTPQEIFDITAKHLLKQNEQANEQSACQYLTDKGLKCAIGCHIPASLYNAEIESLQVHELFDRFPAIMEGSGLSIKYIRLLRQLQIIHDNSRPSSWPAKLKALAESHDLTFA